MKVTAAGTGAGERRLNGPQTTGRTFRNLSEPRYRTRRDDDVPVILRGGERLLADVIRPAADGRFPALVAASPYPRQIQDLGAPMGFIEAGASDFFVPRGYVHVIANLRGTGGSDGTFGMFDAGERDDLHDLVEWAAAQRWCDGNVGMIGISYFAMAQLAAATRRPPHLRAIFPVATTPDLYEAVHHNGLFSSTFISPWLAVLGVTAGHGDALWRGKVLNAARHLLANPRIHERFEHMNGESAIGGLQAVMRVHYDPHPWDDLWQAAVVEHPLRDAFWEQRNVLEDLGDVDIPVYLGCDWQNVPLHLPGTFSSWAALRDRERVRMGMLPEFGLTWPWESLHVEALAWFDHWLKERDTGILEGPPVRYWMPGAEEWRTSEAWPPTDARHVALALRGDGRLAAEEGEPGERAYLCLGTGLGRPPNANAPQLPSALSWETAPLAHDVDVVGEIELALTATSTAPDTGWIAILQDVAADDGTTEITAGWLRATLREVDVAASRPGAPVLPCRFAQAVPIGERVEYRIPLVPNARRFAAGHRIRLLLTSDDQPEEIPAVMGFRHAPVGTNARNTVHSCSRLLLPVTSAATA
jgi:predicted acyl esterase